MDKKSILIVDDDVVMLKMIRSYLQDDFETFIVPSGQMALKFLQKRVPDLILLDYQMPKMNGIETLKEIRKLGNDIQSKIVFLTGEENDEINKSDADGYILKPVSKSKLLEVVKAIGM